MDEAECDRARQGEDVPAPELGEDLGDDAGLEQVAEGGPELRVDDRQHQAPEEEADGDGNETETLAADRVAEQRTVHRPTSASTAGSSSA